MEFLVNILDVFSSVGGKLPDWVAALTGIVTAATAVTLLTPTKTDDAIVNTILKILNFVAGNFHRNKNADDK